MPQYHHSDRHPTGVVSYVQSFIFPRKRHHHCFKYYKIRNEIRPFWFEGKWIKNGTHTLYRIFSKRFHLLLFIRWHLLVCIMSFCLSWFSLKPVTCFLVRKCYHQHRSTIACYYVNVMQHANWSMFVLMSIHIYKPYLIINRYIDQTLALKDSGIFEIPMTTSTVELILFQFLSYINVFVDILQNVTFSSHLLRCIAHLFFCMFIDWPIFLYVSFPLELFFYLVQFSAWTHIVEDIKIFHWDMTSFSS